MRVGVYLSDLAPKSGGGYTFQQTILQGLFSLKGIRDPDIHWVILYSKVSRETRKMQDENSQLEWVLFRQGWLGRLRDKFARGLESLSVAMGWVALRRPLYSFERFVKKASLDMVWFPTPDFRECGVPYIFTVWDLQHRVQPWFPEVAAGSEWEHREAFYRRAVLGASRVHVANEAAARELQEAYGIQSERLIISPHPCPNLSDLQPQDREVLRNKQGLKRPYFFYPAQFWPHKNHYGLLTAFAEFLRQMGPVADLVLTGTDRGNLTYVQKLAVDLGIAQNVKFLGFVDSAELSLLYREAVALTFLSYFGPENLPPLEAMSVGCPVICSDYKGARSQLGQAVVFVDPSDCSSIAAAMVKVFGDNTMRASLIERGTQHLVSGRFSVEKLMDRIISELRQFRCFIGCWKDTSKKRIG